MEQANKINTYTCELCKTDTVTINLHAGTTPFIITCRSIACGKARAYSNFYRVSQDLLPQYEWYKPTPKELEQENEAVQSHVEQGGLLLRKLDTLMRELHYGYRTRQG